VEDSHARLTGISANKIDDGRGQTFRYSTKRAKKAVKCSALRMLPGTASLRMSSGRIGLDMNASSSRAVSASCSPSTSFRYSSCSLLASVRLILCPRQLIQQIAENGLLDAIGQQLNRSRRCVQHRSRQVDAEGLDAHIVCVSCSGRSHKEGKTATHRCCAPRRTRQSHPLTFLSRPAPPPLDRGGSGKSR
jgi:hypothetical protein